MTDKLSDGKMLFFEDLENSQSMRGPKHYHNGFEIYFMDKGKCDYFIDQKLYHVEEGDLILIPEGTLHKTIYGDREHKRTLIHCSRHFIPTEIADRLPSLLHLYRNPPLVPCIKMLLQQIRTEYHTPDDYSESILISLMHLLFYTLIRNAEGCCHVTSDHPYTEGALAYIKAHFAEPVTLTELARSIGITPEHLSRVFKQKTGFGFSEYLTMFRLQKAEAMLKGDRSLRICDVAFACGFNDSNYFSKRFREIYGFPPGSLRKSKIH